MDGITIGLSHHPPLIGLKPFDRTSFKLQQKIENVHRAGSVIFLAIIKWWNFDPFPRNGLQELGFAVPGHNGNAIDHGITFFERRSSSNRNVLLMYDPKRSTCVTAANSDDDDDDRGNQFHQSAHQPTTIDTRNAHCLIALNQRLKHQPEKTRMSAVARICVFVRCFAPFSFFFVCSNTLAGSFIKRYELNIPAHQRVIHFYEA